MKNIDFDNLKSAVVIDDPAKIAEILRGNFDKVRESSAREAGHPTSTVELDVDGRAKVSKEITGGVDSSGLNMPSAEELARLAGQIKLEWTDELAERVIPYWASDERVDRHGDIVRQRWEFDNFAKNPVVPYSHEWDAPPVGNTLRWLVTNRTESDYTGPALHLLNVFATAEMWQWADTIYRLVKSGFLKSSSVGFYPLTVIDVKDQDERDRLGLGRWGLIFDRNELIEHSPTTVPANTGAVSLLRTAKKNGLLKPHDVQVVRDMARQSIRRGHEDSTAWRRQDAQWRNVWGALFPEVELREHTELDVPLTMDTGGSNLAELCAQIREQNKILAGLGHKLNEATEAIVELREQVEDLQLDQETQNLLDDETGDPEPTSEGQLDSVDMSKLVERAEKAVSSLAR